MALGGRFLGSLSVADTLRPEAKAAIESLKSMGLRTVLLTGVTGFLGRYLALDWLERMDLVDGKVICLVRAKSDEDARARPAVAADASGRQLHTPFREELAEAVRNR